MGSIIQGKSFPAEKRRAFIRAFDQVPQRVIWKWEGETMSGKIDKILLINWAPQRDILGKYYYCFTVFLFLRVRVSDTLRIIIIIIQGIFYNLRNKIGRIQ